MSLPSITGSIEAAYHITKLVSAGACALVHMRWRIWRAKKHFEAQLVEGGLPRRSIDALVNRYDEQNKQLIQALVGFARFRSSER